MYSSAVFEIAVLYSSVDWRCHNKLSTKGFYFVFVRNVFKIL